MFRGENGELRVGVRRAMRQQGNVPSSVISCHSMHLGVLATAWHAISTGTMFTVYYKPRFVALWRNCDKSIFSSFSLNCKCPGLMNVYCSCCVTNISANRSIFRCSIYGTYFNNFSAEQVRLSLLFLMNNIWSLSKIITQ